MGIRGRSFRRDKRCRSIVGHLQSLMAQKASTEEYDIVIIGSGSTQAWLSAACRRRDKFRQSAVLGDDEIRSAGASPGRPEAHATRPHCPIPRARQLADG